VTIIHATACHSVSGIAIASQVIVRSARVRDVRASPAQAHTIVDYLEEFQTMLMSEDYLGI
jgi:hypothetical protein